MLVLVPVYKYYHMHIATVHKYVSMNVFGKTFWGQHVNFALNKWANGRPGQRKPDTQPELCTELSLFRTGSVPEVSSSQAVSFPVSEALPFAPF